MLFPDGNPSPEMTPSTRPLLKTEFADLPVRIPCEWRDFFDLMAYRLNCPRNQAICMALKFGSPILERFVSLMESEIETRCELIGRLKARSTLYEVLGVPPTSQKLLTQGHERDENGRATGPDPGPSGPGEPQSGRKGQEHRCPAQKAAQTSVSAKANAGTVTARAEKRGR